MRSADERGSPWTELVAGTSVVDQLALDRLDVPALILELPSRRIRAANQAIAELFAVPRDEIVGRVNSDVVDFADEDAMKRASEALASGAIDGFRARRSITSRDGKTKQGVVWGRAIDLEGSRFAVYIVIQDGIAQQSFHPPIAWAGPIVVGTASPDLLVERVSSDVLEVLGEESSRFVDHSLLSLMHPDDAAQVVRAVRKSPVEGMTAPRVRMRHADGRWVLLQALFTRLTNADPPPVAFALMPDPLQDEAVSTDRLQELEARLRGIARELNAAGYMLGIDHLPTASEFPQLNSLSSRQWQILVRLLRGERVPAIARELFLSPRTVRNHLTAIFQRFGVHSQAELIAALRGRRGH